MVAGFTPLVLSESGVALVHEEAKQKNDDDISCHHYEAPLQHFENILTKLSRHLGGWTGSGATSNILSISRVVNILKNIFKIFSPVIVVYLYYTHYQIIKTYKDNILIH